MTKWLIALSLTALTFLFTACGGPDVGALEAQIQGELLKQMDLVDRKYEILEDRLVLLSRENEKLSDKLDRLLTEVENPGDLTNQVAEILGLQVEDLIRDQLAAKIGDKPMASITANSIRTEIATYEAEKEAEREVAQEAERERRKVEEEKRSQERFASMVETLSLNQQQSEQLSVAQETMQETMTEIFTKMREGSFEGDRREAFAGLREAHETIVREFMSDEQAESYLERYNRGPGGGRGGPGGGGGGRGGR